MTHPSTETTASPDIPLAVRVRVLLTNVLIGALFALFAYAAFTNWRRTGQIQMLLLAFQ